MAPGYKGLRGWDEDKEWIQLTNNCRWRTITNGYELTWAFKLDWDWVETHNNVDLFVRAIDVSNASSGWQRKDVNGSYEPDLVISSSTPSASCVKAGHDFRVSGTVTFQSSGYQPADWTGISVCMDRDRIGGTRLAKDTSISNGYELHWTPGDSDIRQDPYSLYVYVENSKNPQQHNNSDTYWDLEHVRVCQDIDLVADDLWTDPDPPKGTATIHWRVKAYGAAFMSVRFFVSLAVNNNIVESWECSGNLGTFGSASWQDSFRICLGSGHPSIRLVADTNDEYIECDEANNSRTESFAWQAANWTFLVFLHNGGNLSQGADVALEQFAAASGNSEVNVVVLRDYLSEQDYAFNMKDATDPKAYNRYEDKWLPSDLGLASNELNMGDGHTLAAFTRWGVQHFPANHYGLMVWDHGSGWGPKSGSAGSDTPDFSLPKGCCHDNGDFLTTRELADGIAAGASAAGGKLGVVDLAACLMQMVEVAFQFRDSADFLVGHESMDWTSASYSYDDFLRAITSDTTPEQLATRIAQEYDNFMRTTSVAYAVSVVRLSVLGNMVAKLNLFAHDLIYALASHADELNVARTSAQTFDYDGSANNESTDSYIDLKHFAQCVKNYVSHADATGAHLATSADGLIASLNNLIVANYEQSGSSGAGSYDLRHALGISIYFPMVVPDEVDGHDYYANYLNRGNEPAHLAFVDDANNLWDDFLQYYHHEYAPPVLVTFRAVAKGTGGALDSSHYATVHYVYRGEGKTAHVYDGHSTEVSADLGSEYQYETVSAGSDSNHRWASADPPQGTISAATGEVSGEYYEQYHKSFGVETAGGGTKLSSENYVEVNITQFGHQVAGRLYDEGHDNAIFRPANWVDARSTYHFSTTSSASGEKQRWQVRPSDPTEGTVNDANHVKCTYFHQYLLDFGAEAQGSHSLDSNNYGRLLYTSFGADAEAHCWDTSRHRARVWADRHTPYTFVCRSSGSDDHHRWAFSDSDLKGDTNAPISYEALFLEQWKPTIELPGTDKDHRVLIEARTLFGQDISGQRVYSIWSDWCDDGSRLSFGNTTDGTPTRVTRDPTSWTITQAFTKQIHYTAAPTLTGLRLTPADDLELEFGQSQQFHLFASYSDDTEKEVTDEASWSWTGDAQAGGVDAHGLFTAGDHAGSGQVQATYHDLSAHSGTVTVKGHEIEHSFPAGWQLTTVPYTGATIDLPSLFSSTYIYRWDSSAQRYDRITTAQQGQGFWVWCENQRSVTVQLRESPPSVVTAAVQKGWNTLGNPFPMPIGYGNGITIPPEVQGTLWIWTGQGYARIDEPTQVLDAWRGFWVFAPDDTQVEFKPLPPPAPTAAHVHNAGRKRSVADSSAQWRVRLLARCGDLQDTSCSFGVARTSSAFVTYKPPLPLDVGPCVNAFLKPATAAPASSLPLADLFLPENSLRLQWRLVVQTVAIAPGTELNIFYPDLTGVPSCYRLTITDLASGKKQNMRTSTRLTVRLGQSDATSREFLIEATRKATSAVVISQAALHQATSHTVQAVYTLNNSAWVTLEIRNLAGRLVRTVVRERLMPSGSHVATWNRLTHSGVMAPPGTYLWRIRARSQDGQVVHRMGMFTLR